ncbi:MAG: tRNA (adenosine(37)-N6)-dimethylallyltransferase MiaA [Candidatus Binatia bacterium]
MIAAVGSQTTTAPAAIATCRPASSARHRIVALVGPTGVGKTALSIELARRLHAEIVSADSRQVYRRLDIGSAKPTRAQRAAVPHHLIDVVDPQEWFDCAQFRRLAVAAIAAIQARHRRVLLVGGTGLYVRALLEGVYPGPARDPELRARLARDEAATPGILHRRLQVVDAVTAARLHPHDRVRLIRALEVFERTGRPISVWQSEHGFRQHDFDVRLLGLWRPRAELYARIGARCQAMVAEGLVEEVTGLYASGLDADLPVLRSPGYREIGEYVRGRCTLAGAIARMVQATRRLAKRQLTWFRADPRVVWCPPDVSVLAREAEVV